METQKRALELMQTSTNEEIRYLSQIFSNGLRTFFYGCGNQGFICEDLFVNSMAMPVGGFVVSDGQPLEVKWNTCLPVCSISDLHEEKEQTCLLLTMGYSTACKIKETLEEKGYKHIHLIKDWERVNDALREISLLIALEKNGYSLSHEVDFKIDTFYFINPYQNELIRTMFMRECENIIGERYLKETKNKIDSSYESGKVRLEENDVVIDCGANIGLFSAYAASLGGGKVLAFEPVKYIADVTNRVAALYPGKITVIEKALSDREGKINFMEVDEADYFHSDSSRITVESETANMVEVPTVTIDTVVEEYKLDGVDFIKADIEGAERYMLKGAKNTLQKYGPKLAICTYHLPDDKEVLTQIILEANPKYVIEYKWDKLYAYIPKEG